MENDIRTKCIMKFYEIYPLSRKIVFDTFDRKKYHLTRTQQIIILSLSVSKTLTMSHLAARINTSNEQATRAVSQLVDMGFVVREHDRENRRLVNISLTDKAEGLLKQMKSDIHDEMIKRFKEVSDDDMDKLYEALQQVSEILKKVADE